MQLLIDGMNCRRGEGIYILSGRGLGRWEIDLPVMPRGVHVFYPGAIGPKAAREEKLCYHS